jgi:hypothetical protein
MRFGMGIMPLEDTADSDSILTTVVSQLVTSVSEELTAFIFFLENGDSRFLQNVAESP